MHRRLKPDSGRQGWASGCDEEATTEKLERQVRSQTGMCKIKLERVKNEELWVRHGHEKVNHRHEKVNHPEDTC